MRSLARTCGKNDASANELFRSEVDSTDGVVVVAFLDDNASNVDVPTRRNAPEKTESALKPLTENQKKRKNAKNRRSHRRKIRTNAGFGLRFDGV